MCIQVDNTNVNRDTQEGCECKGRKGGEGGTAKRKRKDKDGKRVWKQGGSIYQECLIRTLRSKIACVAGVGSKSRSTRFGDCGSQAMCPYSMTSAYWRYNNLLLGHARRGSRDNAS